MGQEAVYNKLKIDIEKKGFSGLLHGGGEVEQCGVGDDDDRDQPGEDAARAVLGPHPRLQPVPQPPGRRRGLGRLDSAGLNFWVSIL